MRRVCGRRRGCQRGGRGRRIGRRRGCQRGGWRQGGRGGRRQGDPGRADAGGGSRRPGGGHRLPAMPPDSPCCIGCLMAEPDVPTRHP
jgi:hypothetical protein